MPKIDLAKRRRVMQRSQKLGHCVCEPRRPCPCDVFTDKGICPCAGERPDPVDLSSVRLTQLVHNAGCASKISPADLEKVLSRLPAVDDPAIISGIPAADDAAIYRLADGTYLVQTVDVMTPCVDDPYLFGRICAANCLSDIYAMGGTPRTALSILAFPSETLDGEIMYQMMKGAMDVLAQARCALIGGHSIKDEEIKLGFAITGVVEASRLARHDTAQVGDVLILTKPLGVGVLNFARQIGRDVGDLAAAAESMAQLNKAAAEAAGEVGVSACTDVTGFGLFGHLISMLRHSGVTAEVVGPSLPAFAGVVEALEQGVVPGAVERNMEYLGGDLDVAADVPPCWVNLGLDAQTSGGLLIAVPAVKARELAGALTARGVAAYAIGSITETSSGRIRLVASSAPGAGESQRSPSVAESHSSQKQPHSESCCADAFGPPAAGATHVEASAATSAPASNQAFGALMRSAAQAGAIDARTKELIQFSLVVLSRCEPCFAHHYEYALELGITPTELEEAAWCAVAMGGAPVRMFYQQALKQAKGQDEGCCPK